MMRRFGFRIAAACRFAADRPLTAAHRYTAARRALAALTLTAFIFSLVPPQAWALGTPAQEVGQHTAIVDRVSGVVEVQEPGKTTWTRVQAGQQVQTGDKIRTFASGSARVRIGDVGVVEITPRSLVRIGDLRQVRTIQRAFVFLTRPVTEDNVDVNLIRGQTNQSFSRPGGNRVPNYRVTTPVATAGVRGTTFSTRVDDPEGEAADAAAEAAAAATVEATSDAAAARARSASSSAETTSSRRPLQVSAVARRHGVKSAAHSAVTLKVVTNALLQGVVIGAVESIRATQGTITIERTGDKFVFTLGTQKAELGIDDVSEVDGNKRQAYDGRGIVRALESKNATLAIAISGVSANTVYIAIDKLVNPPPQPAKIVAYGLRGATVGSGLGVFLVVKFQDASGKEFKMPSGSSRDVTVSKVGGPGDLKGATTATVAAGSSAADFSGLNVEKVGTYVLRFTSGSLTADATLIVGAGAAAKLVMLTDPAGAEPGKAFATQPRVGAVDKFGHAVPNYVASVEVAIASGNGTLTASRGRAPSEVSTSGGVVTFEDLTIDKAGTYTLKFTDKYNSALTVTSASFTVAEPPKPPSKLQVMTFLTPDPLKLGLMVEFLDANGREVEIPASSPRDVTISIASGPGTLVGPTTVKATGTRVSFDNTTFTKPGRYTLKFTSPGLTEATANVDVMGPPASIAMSSFWRGSTQTAGREMSGVMLEFSDEAGHRVTRFNNQEVSVALVGSGELKGTTKITVSGTEMWPKFEDLVIDKAGTYTLKFSSPGCRDLTITVNVQGGRATKLMLLTQPAGGEPGNAFTTQPKVGFYDAFGNASPNRDNVTVSIATGSGNIIATKKYYADADNIFYIYSEADGTVDFGNLGLGVDKAGTYTLKFTSNSYPELTVTSAPFTVAALPVATSLAIKTQPAGATAGTAFTTQPKVEIRDQYDKVMTGFTGEVTAAIASGVGALSGTAKVRAVNGVATFSGLALDKAGNFTLKFTAGNLSATSSPFSVAQPPPVATKIEIVTQTSGATAGTVFTTQPKVEIRDQYDKVMTGFTGEVTAAIASGAGTLSGTAKVRAVNGVATFSGLALDKAGNFTLKFTAGNLSATTSPFSVAQPPPVATKIEIVTQPSGSEPGKAFTTQPKVEIRDQYDKVMTGFTGEVTAAIASGNGTLSGTAKVRAVNGVATFSGLAIDNSGDFTLKFTSGNLSATSASFKLEVAVPSLGALAAMTPAQFAALPPAAFEKMTANHFKAIKPELYKVMTTAQFEVMKNGLNFAPVLTPQQIAAFSPANIKLLQPVQLGRFSTTQLQALTTDQRGALTDDQKNYLTEAQKRLLGLITPVDPSAVTTVAQMTAMTPADLNKMSPERFKNIAPDAFGSLRMAQIRAFTPDQIKAMTDDQFAKLKDNPEFLTGLIYMQTSQISAFKPAHIAMMTTDQIRRLKTDQLKALTPEQVAALTDQQKAALGSAKLALLAKPPAAAAPSTPVATKLAFSAIPPSATAAQTFAPPVKIEVRDTNGAVVTSSTVQVAVILDRITGTSYEAMARRNVNAAAGVVTVSDLKTDTPGSYRLRAIATGLSMATSANFEVAGSTLATTTTVTSTVPTADQFIRMTAAQIAAMTPEQFSKIPADAFGSLNEAQMKAITVEQVKVMTAAQTEVFKGAAIISIMFTPAKIAAITPENLKLYQKTQISRMSDEQLKALTAEQRAALTAEQKAALSTDQKILLGFEQRPVVATKLAVTAQPTSATAGQAFSPVFTVEVRDASGAKFATSTAEVTAAVASDPGALLGTQKVNAANGVATFTGLRIEKAGTYTLKFTAPGLAEAISVEFEVKAGDPVKAVIVTGEQASAPHAGVTGALASAGGAGPGWSLTPVSSFPAPVALAAAPSATDNADRRTLRGGLPIGALAAHTTAAILFQSLIAATGDLKIEYQDQYGNTSMVNGTGTVTLNGKSVSVTIVNGRVTLTPAQLTENGLSSPYTLSAASFGTKTMQVTSSSSGTTVSGASSAALPVAPDGSVDVVITSNSGLGIGAYQATINFDPNIVMVDAKNVSGGTGAGFTATPTSINVDNVGGSLTINAFQIGNSPTGRFTVARIGFTPVAAGNSTLSVAGAPDCALFDKNGGDVTLSASNAITLSKSTLTIAENQVPTISSLSPGNVSIGANGFTLTVTGLMFARNAVVLFDDRDLTTTYVSARSLKASVPASLLTTGGAKTVIVTNQSPGGGASEAAVFNVNNPTPQVTSVSPTSSTAGTSSLTLTVNGKNFVTTSKVLVGDVEWPTAFVSETRLTAEIPSGTALSSGVFAVKVKSPAPSAGSSGLSNSKDLTVSGGTPVAAKPANFSAPSVMPSAAIVGNEPTCAPGTWSGEPTFTYQWVRGTTAITTAMAAKYTVVATDAGQSLTCVVTATNAGGSATATSNAVTVAEVTVSGVAPATVTLNQGGTQQFVATVTGTTNTAVTWSASGGTIDANGNYTAPNMAGTYTVRATSQADPRKYSEATVTVRAGGITVSPTSVTLKSGGDVQQFSASVTGTSNTAVTWSVRTAAGEGTAEYWHAHTDPPWGSISENGLYTSPANAGMYTVRATSQADPTKFVDVLVTALSFTISSTGIAATLHAGEVKQFTAAITGPTTNNGVTWSVPTPGGGTIDATGLYTAPSTAGTYTVRATATSFPTKYSEVSVKVTEPLANTAAPSVTPAAARVGDVLTSTSGTWNQTVDAFKYQWMRGTTAISGANAATYTTVTADAGQSITCVVTPASMPTGSTLPSPAPTATSNAVTVAAATQATVVEGPNDQYVQRLHTAYFGRSADAMTLARWKNNLDASVENNANLEELLTQISKSMATSTEFTTAISGLDNDHIVAKLYRNLFNREPDAAGLLFWSAALGRGDVKIDQVVRVLIENATTSDLESLDNRARASATKLSFTSQPSQSGTPTSTSVAVSFTVSGTGDNVRVIALPANSPAPTAAQVIAATSAQGTSPAKTATTGTPQTVTITGLTAGTVYDFYAALENAVVLSTKLTLTTASVAPTVVIATSDDDLAVREVATITLTLSEASANFSVGDIAVSGGTVSGFTAISSTVYLATFTPTPNSTGTATISVAGGNFTNSAGNPNAAATPLTMKVNTAAATASTGLLTGAAITLDNYAAGAPATWTVTFTTPSVIPARITVTLPGFTFAGRPTVAFTSPTGMSPAIASWGMGRTLTVQSTSPIPLGTVTFTVQGGTNPAAAQAALNNVSMTTFTRGGDLLAQTSVGTLPAITAAASSEEVTPGSEVLSIGNAVWGFTRLPVSIAAGQAFGSNAEIRNNSARTHNVVLFLQTAQGGNVDEAVLTGRKNLTLSSRGTLTLSDLAVTQAGTYYLVARNAQSVAQAYRSSRTFTVTAAAVVATKLAVSAPTPASPTAGADFSVTVTAKDARDGAVTGFTGDITLALSGGAAGATLSRDGGLTVKAVAGVTTFSGLRVSAAGTNYVLTASSGSGSNAIAGQTNAFTVAAAVAANPYAPWDFGLFLEPEAPARGQEVRFRVRGQASFAEDIREMARGSRPEGIFSISIQNPSRTVVATVTRGTLATDHFLTEAWTIPADLSDGLYTVRGSIGGNPSMADKTFRIGAALAGADSGAFQYGLDVSPTSIAPGGKVNFTIRGDALRNAISTASREAGGRSTGVGLGTVEIRSPGGAVVATVTGSSISGDRELRTSGWISAATAAAGSYTAQGKIAGQAVTPKVAFTVTALVVAAPDTRQTLTVVVASGNVSVTGTDSQGRRWTQEVVAGKQLQTTTGSGKGTVTDANENVLRILQAVQNAAASLQAAFSAVADLATPEGRARFKFRLSPRDLTGFVANAGGADQLGQNLMVAIRDPQGNLMAATADVPAPAMEPYNASTGTISFTWTAPAGTAPGIYEARVLLKGVPATAPTASFMIAGPRGATDSSTITIESIKPSPEDLYAALTTLFLAYSREDVQGFVQRVDPTFSGTADNLVSLSSSTIQSSLEEDFRNYDNISYDWRLNTRRDFENGIVEAEVFWNERLTPVTGSSAGTELRRAAKTTTFVFRPDGAELKLTTWRGVAAFGLSAPGGISTFQPGSSIPPGDIYSPPATGTLNVIGNQSFASDLLIGAGQTYQSVVVASGGSITMGAGTRIRLMSGGTLTLGSASTLTGAGWTGLSLEGGTMNQQGSLAITGATNGIEVTSGATPTVTQSGSMTISGFANRAILVNSGGALTLSNVSASGTGIILETQGGSLSLGSSTITTTGATSGSFTGAGTVSLTASTVTGSLSYNAFFGTASISNTTVSGTGSIIDLTNFTGTLGLTTVTLAANGAATSGVGFASGSGTVNVSGITTSGAITTPISSAAAVSGTINLSGFNTLGGTSTTGISVACGTVQTSSGSTGISGANTGVSVTGGTVSLSNLSFSAITTTSIDVTGGTATFSNSTIGGGGTNAVSQSAGSLTLTNCTLTGSSSTPLTVSGTGSVTITNGTITSAAVLSASFAGTGSVSISGSTVAGDMQFSSYSGSASISNTSVTGVFTILDLTNFTSTLGLTNVTLTSLGAPANAGLGFTSGSGTVNVSGLTTTGMMTSCIEVNPAATGTINLSGSNTLGNNSANGILVGGGTVQTSSGTTAINTSINGVNVVGGTVSLSGLTISTIGATDVGVAGGTVTITSSTLSGGGPANVSQSGGTLTVSNSTLSSAIMVAVATTAGDLTLTNNTITGGMAGPGVDWSSPGTLMMTNGTVQNSGTDGISFTAGTVSLTGVTVSGNTGNGIVASAAGASITNCAVSGHSTFGNAGIHVNANTTITDGSSNSNDEGIDVANGIASISGITLSSNTTYGLLVSGGTATTSAPTAVTISSNGTGAFCSSGALNLTSANVQNNAGHGVNGTGGGTINLNTVFITDNNGAFGLTNSVATPTDSNGPPNQYDNVTSVINPAFVLN